MRYLITTTLLNSWLWYINSNENQEEKALDDFLITLNRKKIKDNRYMIAGREFEKSIYDYLYNHIEHVSPNIIEIAEIVTGGTWQVKGYNDINVNGIDYLIYGIADVIKGPTIYDIKYTTKYMTGKYFKSAQHKIYFHCFPETLYFEYLVCDGRNVYKEKYCRKDTEDIPAIIETFNQWLTVNPDLKKTYFDLWGAYD